MVELNHKTVFILDHTQYFGIASENYIDLDCLKIKRLAPALSKSLWTCAVEGAIEYSRIVWDLFPKGKLVSFVDFKENKIPTINIKCFLDSVCC